MYYTKYRPQIFSAISRPNQVADSLVKQLLSDKIAHAYLFVGSRGTGKTTTARILAKALNCKKLQKNGDPCDKCENCLEIKSGGFNDLIEIDAASNRGIDDIRQLKEKVNLAASTGKYKVYIIDEVHMLTTEAFNALLKTIEEPPKNVVFILCTTELHKVPETIKSRCQVFTFKRATKEQLIKKLSEIATSEGAQVESEVLSRIYQASVGGFRDAETLLQQFIEGDINLESIVSQSNPAKISEFINSLISKDAKSALNFVNEVVEEGSDVYVWTSDVIFYLRDILLFTNNALDISDLTDSAKVCLENDAKSLTISQNIKFIETFIKAQKDVKSSLITQLPIEIAIIELTQDLEKPNTNTTTPKVTKNNSPSDNLVIDSSFTGSSTSTKETTIEDIAVELLEHNTTKILVSVEDPESAVIIEEDVVSVSVAGDMSLGPVVDNWQNIINDLMSKNGSIAALLKNSNPLRVQDNSLVLEVFFAFHKERLEHSKNRKMVEDSIHSVLSMPLTIKCEINPNKPSKYSKNETGVLTDHNVIQISTDDPNSIINVFDGNLPLGMAK